MKRMFMKLLDGLVRKHLERIMTEDNLKVWATKLNKEIDIPVLNEVQEQQLLETILVMIGSHLRDYILGSK